MSRKESWTLAADKEVCDNLRPLFYTREFDNFSNMYTYLECVDISHPDLIILESEKLGMDAASALKLMKSISRSLVFIILPEYHQVNHEQMIELMGNGLDWWFKKPINHSDMASKMLFLANHIQKKTIDIINPEVYRSIEMSDTSTLPELTPNEKKVLEFIKDGKEVGIEELMKCLYGSLKRHPKNVNVTISNINKKIIPCNFCIQRSNEGNYFLTKID